MIFEKKVPNQLTGFYMMAPLAFNELKQLLAAITFSLTKHPSAIKITSMQ